MENNKKRKNPNYLPLNTFTSSSNILSAFSSSNHINLKSRKLNKKDTNENLRNIGYNKSEFDTNDNIRNTEFNNGIKNKLSDFDHLIKIYKLAYRQLDLRNLNYSVERDSEVKFLEEKIYSYLEQNSGGFIDISGLSGVGKSCVVNYVVKNIKNNIKYNKKLDSTPITIHCANCNNLIFSLMNEIFGFPKRKNQSKLNHSSELSRFTDIICSFDKIKICILEELDYLNSNNRTRSDFNNNKFQKYNCIKRELIQSSTLDKSKLIIIALSNSIESIKECEGPRYNQIVFPPYKEQQLSRIIYHKFEPLGDEINKIFNVKSPELVFRRVANQSGDIRTSLSILRKAISQSLSDLKKYRDQLQQALDNSTNSDLCEIINKNSVKSEILNQKSEIATSNNEETIEPSLMNLKTTSNKKLSRTYHRNMSFSQETVSSETDLLHQNDNLTSLTSPFGDKQELFSSPLSSDNNIFQNELYHLYNSDSSHNNLNSDISNNYNLNYDNLHNNFSSDNLQNNFSSDNLQNNFSSDNIYNSNLSLDNSYDINTSSENLQVIPLTQVDDIIYKENLDPSKLNRRMSLTSTRSTIATNSNTYADSFPYESSDYQFSNIENIETNSCISMQRNIIFPNSNNFKEQNVHENINSKQNCINYDFNNSLLGSDCDFEETVSNIDKENSLITNFSPIGVATLNTMMNSNIPQHEGALLELILQFTPLKKIYLLALFEVALESIQYEEHEFDSSIFYFIEVTSQSIYNCFRNLDIIKGRTIPDISIDGSSFQHALDEFADSGICRIINTPSKSRTRRFNIRLTNSRACISSNKDQKLELLWQPRQIVFARIFLKHTLNQLNIEDHFRSGIEN